MDPLRGALPYLREPQDTLRQGLPNLKEETRIAHPLETIQNQGAKERQAKEYEALKNVYGAAFPAKMQIEREILGRFGRLPGLPSSRLGLQALTGELDELSFDSYLGLPEHSERPETDLHTQMEAKLNMALYRP